MNGKKARAIRKAVNKVTAPGLPKVAYHEIDRVSKTGERRVQIVMADCERLAVKLAKREAA